MLRPVTPAIALFLLTLSACVGAGDASRPPNGQLAPVRKVMQGDAAMKEIVQRTGEGDVTADVNRNGVRATKYEYPDGAIALISSGPGRKDYAYWPPAKGPDKGSRPANE